MKIIIDAFRGDNAPLEILKGCEAVVKSLDIDIVLTGRKDEIRQVAEENQTSLERTEISGAPQALTMEDHVGAIMKEKKDLSMVERLCLVAKGRGDAFVSAGNSSALAIGATIIVKRIKGIKRVALAPMTSGSKDFSILTDSGADVGYRLEVLLQFGITNLIHLDKAIDVRDPRIAPASVGIEDHKGGELQYQTFVTLKESEPNSIGNIEACDISNNSADVVVADGFAGNIILKMFEGVVSMVMGKFKKVFTKSPKNKTATVLLLGDMTALKKSMDCNEYGDTPVIGTSKPVLKVHDSAKARTVESALRLTKAYVEKNVTEEIKRAISDQGQCDISKQDEGKSMRIQRPNFKDLEEKLQRCLRNLQYLITAVAHPSYANEVRSDEHSNKRLEFLGDSVLSIVVADYLFKHCPSLPEGELTKSRAALVCEKTLCGFSRQPGLGEYLLFSRGEQNFGGRQRPSILVDVFKALITAIYLGTGLEKARGFILRPVLPVLRTSRSKVLKDYKTPLQEIIQRNLEGQLKHVLVGESGPNHNRHFTAGVCLNSNVIGKGGGHSKKETKQQVVCEALELMGY